jgi:hypothetical protein
VESVLCPGGATDGNEAKASLDAALCTGGCLFMIEAKPQTIRGCKKKMNGFETSIQTQEWTGKSRPNSIGIFANNDHYELFRKGQIGLIVVQLFPKQPSESQIHERCCGN